MEQCCQRNVSGSRHLSHSKSSPRRRGTRHLQPPAPSRLQAGLETLPSCHKAPLRNQSDTLFGYFPHSARRARACSAIQARASADDSLAAEPQTSNHCQPGPAYALRQARAPAVKTGSLQRSMPPSRRTDKHKHKHKLARQLPCRKLFTPSATRTPEDIQAVSR